MTRTHYIFTHTAHFFPSENNEKIKFKKLYWRERGEKLQSLGNIIAQFQNGTDIKISNLRNYFDEETLYFHSHWEKVHIIAQYQNATDKKTETEILVCIIFLFLFVLISIRICTYLELYSFLYLIRYLWIKVFPVSKGSFSPRLVAWLARLINFPQLCSPHRNIKLPYCKNIICKKYTNPAQQTYINIIEVKEMWNEKYNDRK